jgi:glycosyltransferase involved in cell wall biosynthesis
MPLRGARIFLAMPASLPDRSAHIALLPWGHIFEDFLDGIGVSFDQFCTEMSGGWLFGYVQALQLAGFRVTIFCFSSQIRIHLSARHQFTNAEICLIPATRSYRWLRSFFADPYAWETENMFAGRKIPTLMKKLLRHLLPYFATPVSSLRREIRRRAVDVILCQEYEYARFDVLTALGSALGLPVFATFQGGNWQVSRLEKFTRPRALEQCAGLIIGPAKEAARVQAEYRLTSRKIARIPNPIDLEEWQPIPRTKAREALALPLSARIAISHGRIDILRKGLDVLLAAWTNVRAAHPDQDWRLILIGSGDGAAKLENMLSGQHSVTWINSYIRDRACMRRWLSAADVYVMASRHEGFPVAPLEGMACGLPIIATAVPGIAELMGEEAPLPGITVPVTDVAALSDALSRLLGDIELSHALGWQAKKRAQKFSLGSVSGQLRDFLSARPTSNRAPMPV